MSLTLRNVFSHVAVAGVLYAGLVATDVAAQELRSGKCHNGSAWNSRLEANGLGSAALVPCGQEEPASIIALTCERDRQRVAVEIDLFARGITQQTRTVPLGIMIDSRSRTYQTKANFTGMYELLEFDVRSDHPLIERLASLSYSPAQLI